MQPKQATPLYTPRLRRLAPGRWVVESRTRPGIGYPCTVDACGCPAGKHGRLCWHKKLVRRVEAWLAGYAAPAPTTATVVGVPGLAPTRPTGMRALQEAFEG